MPNGTNTLYVEGSFDRKVVEALLKAAKYPFDDLKIIVASGKSRVADMVAKHDITSGARCAALIDSDSNTVQDAEREAQGQLGNPGVPVFCAIPTVEAWFFADIDALKRHVHRDNHHDWIDRLPLPEQIPNPLSLLKTLFPKREAALAIFEDIDLSIATSRSASLHAFLTGIGDLLGVEKSPAVDSYSRNLGRDVFSNLLSEVFPSSTVVFRTMDGTAFTADEMIRNIREGSGIGQQYASDLLRVARDLMTRQVQRQKVS